MRAKLIRNIVLFGVLIYERIGPMTTKIALTKAGEIQPKAKRCSIAAKTSSVPSRRAHKNSFSL